MGRIWTQFNLSLYFPSTVENVRAHDLASWSTLLSALQDTTHPLAQSLRELHIEFRDASYHNVVADVQDTVFARVSAVLQSNRYLTRAELWTSQVVLVTKYSASVMAHRGEYLPEEEAPMPSAAKLAFLGALSQAASGSPPVKMLATEGGLGKNAARFKVNPESVQIVFDYAAKAKARICGMQVKPKED